MRMSGVIGVHIGVAAKEVVGDFEEAVRSPG